MPIYVPLFNQVYTAANEIHLKNERGKENLLHAVFRISGKMRSREILTICSH